MKYDIEPRQKLKSTHEAQSKKAHTIIFPPPLRARSHCLDLLLESVQPLRGTLPTAPAALPTGPCLRPAHPLGFRLDVVLPWRLSDSRVCLGTFRCALVTPRHRTIPVPAY